MKKIILASKSKARVNILTNSGIKFEAIGSNVDETKIKQKCLIEKLDSKVTSLKLAQAKALEISKKYDNHLVIGADQILECDNILFSKAENINEAKEVLKFLRNKTHYLVNGVTIAINNEIVWNYNSKIKMAMRNFSDNFLDNYVENNPEIINSVGCYFLEGEGIQLFSEIESDYFGILGLPIIPILDFLRNKEVVLK
ncbi:MAG: nucleoside triphosphate pyrophosphatase [Alphaproteobacteria bacterium]